MLRDHSENIHIGSSCADQTVVIMMMTQMTLMMAKMTMPTTVMIDIIDNVGNNDNDNDFC